MRFRAAAWEAFFARALRSSAVIFFAAFFPPWLPYAQLPPGWQKKMQPFPYEIEHRLPPIPDGCARGYMDGYAVVYEPRTRVIVDIHAVFGR